VDQRSTALDETYSSGFDVMVLGGSELARRGLREMLNSLDSVGRVQSCRPAYPTGALPDDQKFDILILACDDIGPGCAHQLADEAWNRGAKVLLLLGGREDENLDMVTAIPSNGFLMQDEVTEDSLGQALRRMISGEIPMPPALVNRLLSRARDASTNIRTECAKLTPREREALALLVEGLSNKQIARRMTISPHGVKRLVANVLAKLNCSNRTLAVAMAIKQGILEDA